jgi:hypothetical protein
MSGNHAWLYYLFGGLMLSVAAYCLALLVTSLPTRRSAGRDVELSHVFMGVAMAGMFVPAWAFGPSGLWELLFGALLVLFVVRALQSVQRFGLHVPHTAVHALMSFAMLLMYWFPSSTTAGAMSMSASGGGAHMDPGLALLVGFVLFASAIFTVASPNRGATHFGTHGDGCHGASRPRPAVVDGKGTETALAVVALDDALCVPTLVDATHVIMCVAMGVMLIFMI